MSQFKLMCAFIIFTVSTMLSGTSGTVVNITDIYRSYLQNMVDSMEENISPCEDFFQHACGNMNTSLNENSAERTSGNGRMSPYLYNHQDYYEFFVNHKVHFASTPGLLVRNLYDLCKESQFERKSPRHVWWHMINDIPFLQNDVNLLRKWPFLQYQWTTYEHQLNLNWPLLAAEFSAHGFEIFFNIFFAENTIYLTPNNDFLCPDYEEFGESLMPLLGQRNPQVATIIGTEMWQFCWRLRGEVPQESMEETNFFMDETRAEFLQRYFLRLNLTHNDIEDARKIAVNVQTLNQIMTILKSTNTRIVYNYILWHVYRQLSAMDDCFRFTDEFRHLLQAEYWQWNVFDDHFRREVAIPTYIFHTTRFQRLYRRTITSSSLERLTQKRSRRKELNIEKSIRNYARQYLNPDNYTAIYQSQVFDSENRTFYSSLLEMRRLSLRYSFHNSYVDAEDLNFFQEFIDFCILILYRPRLHYFASYDRKMWEDSHILRSSDGLYTVMDCLERQTLLHIDDYGELYATLDMERVNSLFDFYTSFKEAETDYNFWLESENFAMAEDFILEYFQLDSYRIMFYAVAQQMCARNDPLFSSIINRSFMNSDKFQRAFECTEDDPMNPLEKCMIQR